MLNFKLMMTLGVCYPLASTPGHCSYYGITRLQTLEMGLPFSYTTMDELNQVPLQKVLRKKWHESFLPCKITYVI